MNRDFVELPVVDHAAKAARFISDTARTAWHDKSLWHLREKRDRAAAGVGDWEELRDLASRIKDHTLSRLDEYLVEFEQRATANGIEVHWARNADEHNDIVFGILKARGVRQMVKSKSMLTEECGLNPHLEARGIEVVDTDLGERIVQLAGDTPSHIVAPAIHFKQEEIAALFHDRMGTDARALDPQYLTEAARQDLRATFLKADAAVTGVNFAIAETGGFVVVTNEGNADLGCHLAPVHVACLGIEKLIPRLEHLAVFLRLLARSATGQAITAYTSLFHRPEPGRALHVVIVDNGRTDQLARPHFRASLKCIHCGACMNTCPVYRRSGGHSYGATIPGPIGSILAPGIGMRTYAALPFASTLCGSCSDVCPVKIDIHEQLFRWRQEVSMHGDRPTGNRYLMNVAGWVFGRPLVYRIAGQMVRWLLRHLPRQLMYFRGNVWGRAREMPQTPKRSFHAWHKEARG